VNRVVPDEQLDTEALKLAERIALMPPVSVGITKRSLNKMMMIFFDLILGRGLRPGCYGETLWRGHYLQMWMCPCLGSLMQPIFGLPGSGYETIRAVLGQMVSLSRTSKHP